MNKKETEKYIKDLIEKIRLCCQVDNYEIIEENDNVIMEFNVLDCDCEYYFEDFEIKQELKDKDYYNIINLTKISNKKLDWLE